MTHSMDRNKGESILLRYVSSDLSACVSIVSEPRSPLLFHLPVKVLDPLARTPGGHCAISVTRLLEQAHTGCLQDRLQEERATGVMLLLPVDVIVAYVEFAAPAGVYVQSRFDVRAVELADGSTDLTERVVCALGSLHAASVSEEGSDAEFGVSEVIVSLGEERH